MRRRMLEDRRGHPGDSLRGVTLAFSREGSGEPLVLVHGTGGSRGTWDPIVPRLTARYDVIRVDLPGFGASAPLPAQMSPTVQALASAVQEACAELDVSDPHVAGHSLGGGLALELARRGAARTVTAIAPVGFWTGAESAWCRHSLVWGRRVGRACYERLPRLYSRPNLRALLLGQHVGHGARIPPATAVRWSRDLVDATDFERVNDVANRQLFAGADALAVPVTVAWPENDRLLFPRQARRARRVLPRARHVWLTGCGHTPFYDDPEQVARVVLESAAGGTSGAPNVRNAPL